MHLEQHHHAPSSLREFLRQYAMIVLSILTALALEHLAVDWQNHQDASASRVRIDAELTSDLSDLRSSSTHMAESVKRAQEALTAVIGRIKTGKPFSGDDLNAVQQSFSIALPSLRHSAWDGALADQSASHLPAKLISQYSEIYADMADVRSIWQILLGGEWITRASDTFLNIQIGAPDQRELAGALNRYLLAAQEILHTQQSLGDLIAKALPAGRP